MGELKGATTKGKWLFYAVSETWLLVLWLYLLDQGSEDDLKRGKMMKRIKEDPPPPPSSLCWPMQLFTWETREQRKPLYWKASWRGRRHWWGERRGDGWERRKRRRTGRQGSWFIGLVYITSAALGILSLWGFTLFTYKTFSWFSSTKEDKLSQRTFQHLCTCLVCIKTILNSNVIIVLVFKNRS